MINTKIVFIFLVCVLVIVVAQTFHKLYLSKKTIRENFFNLGDTTLGSNENPTPGLTDATPGLTDATPGLTDATPGLTDATPGLTDATPGLTEATPGLTEATPGLTEATPGLTEATPGLTETTPGLTETTPGLTEATPGLTEATPGLTEATPGLTTIGVSTTVHADYHDNKQYAEITELRKKLKKLENKYRYNYSKTEQIDNELNRAQKILKRNRNKFQNNINKFGEFHDNYQQELQKVLEKKMNVSQQIYDSRKKLNDDKLEKIQKKLMGLKLNETLNAPETNYKSILCKANSFRLNISWISMDGERNYNGNFMIHLNNKCASFILNSTPSFKTFDCSHDADHLQFKCVKISNLSDYNKNIQLEDTDKEMVTRSENINYPFYLVVPIHVQGKCLYVTNTSKVYIDTIKNHTNNRFELSNIQEKCLRN